MALPAVLGPDTARLLQRMFIVQMSLIAICVTAFFVVSYGAAQRWVDPLMRIFRKLDANEAVTSCVLALVLLFAVSAEWLGSVAGITGAYLLGYVFAGAKLKTLIERPSTPSATDF